MAGFLYHVAGIDDREERQLRPRFAELGIAHAFPEPGNLAAVACNGGPEGKAGLVLADTRRTPEVGFYPQRQTWRRLPAARVETPPVVHIGYFSDAPPTPLDLLRPDALPGIDVELGDGNAWRIPQVRAFNDQNGVAVWSLRLPRKLVLDERCEWVPGPVIRKYERLSETAQAFIDEWFSAVRSADPASAELKLNSGDVATIALQNNYAMGPVEIAMLDLLDERCVGQVLRAIIDWDKFLVWAEKKTSGVETAAS